MKAVSSPSQQVCPFCKKPFKRLKTHLPHCKLAKVDKNNGTDVVGTKTLAAESQLTGKKTKQQKNMLLESSEKKNKSKIGKTGELGKLLLDDSGHSTPSNVLSKITKKKKPNLKPKEQQQQVSLTTEKDQRRHLRAQKELSSGSGIPHSGILSIFGTKESLSSERECFEKDQKPHPIMKVKLSKEVENHSAMPAGILKNMDTKWNGTGNTGVQHKGCTWSNPTDLGHQIHGTADDTTLSKLPHSTESTTEWSTGESLATGKKEVWDHIKHSLERMNLDEQEQSATAAFHLSTSCVPCGTLALENAKKSLRATSTMDSIQNTVINHDIICSIQPMERNRQLFKNSSGPVLQQQATLTRSVVPACSLGLQWFPELYPNYISLRLILGRHNHGNIEWNTNKIHTPKKAHHEIPLALRNLMDVRMKELPTWIVNNFSIKTLPGAVQKAWGQYYSKYINVKKGGMGGLTMLLAGYCILSYSWNYGHIKQDRWRRYH
ncbi:uncharacterized protein C17orf80 homolog [Xenopus laevis]|uniref:Uncharacterized protein C17orf80 homolog n=2 Tax=Xenopus laevis TaxID=8355 RepID=A0A1L8EM35_XENLA|nr:uncharacterized protein C17orf80 homolog [Xenopus laevis]XP_018093804.1 uncharacterized protein C17orf80 homolog [Xenopus laevis]OCT60395.1 hypothetical protein XELAEV_18046414mg [Xenopus laevis]